MKIIRIISGLACCLCLISCVQTDQEDTSISTVPDAVATAKEQHQYEPFKLKWLDYADPIADANLAIAKNDFTLLAFSNRGIRFPGVKEEDYDLEQVTTECGVKVLKGTGDMLEPGDDLERRKMLREYAKQYNSLVFEACRSVL